MDITRWELAQSLFHQALELPEAERAAFLDARCDGDAALRAEVAAMLQADGGGASLLDGGLSGIAATIIGEGISVREIGPYKLIRLLGEGGMGAVWLARREDTGTPVAIKFLPNAGLSPTRRERFAREIKTLAKLRHPYIARLYDAGTLADGTPWFVMEYVEGLRLTDYCREHTLSGEQRLVLFRKVCEAVQYAHSREIIHRDLKPSNIFVERDGTPRLLDFGIAREMQGLDDNPGLTRPGLRFYSRDYAAPEWVREGMVGFVTDVYSLGVMLYEVLTGRLPRDHSESPVEATAEAAPVKPSLAAGDKTALGKAAWSDLDVLCLKALRRDPAERYQSVEAMGRDLDHYLKSEPLEARPDSLSYRAGKFVRRNKRPVLAAALTLATVVGLVIFFTVRLTKAKNAAVAEVARRARVENVMLDMLGGTDSNAAPSPDLRVVTLLGHVTQQADSLREDPEIQAELYKVTARMYNMLGDSPRSESLFQLALASEKKALGPDSIEVGDLLIMRGIGLADNSQFKEAEQSIRDGLAIVSRIRPADDPEVFYAQSALGKVVAASGRYDEGIALLQPLTTRVLKTDGERQTMAQTLIALAVAQNAIGRYDDSERTGRQSLALDRQLYGESHPRVASDLYSLAMNLAAHSQYAEAESDCRQATAILTANYGPDHPDTAIFMASLARVLMWEGKEAEAYPLLRKSLEVQDKTPGERDNKFAATLDTLGRIEVDRGDLAAAEADLSRAAAIDASLLGEKNYQTAIIRADLGDVYTRESRPARGEPMIHNSVLLLQAHYPPGDTHIARDQALWGHALVALKKYGDAEQPLTSAYEVLQAQPHPSATDLANIRHDLANVYVALNEPDKAKPYLTEVAGAAPQPAHAE